METLRVSVISLLKETCPSSRGSHSRELGHPSSSALCRAVVWHQMGALDKARAHRTSDPGFSG